MLQKNKFSGMLSATASLGLVLLWDVDGGLTPIDKYLYSAEDYIKVSIYVYSKFVIILERMWCSIRQQLFDKTK
jgi:hypothetical protein